MVVMLFARLLSLHLHLFAGTRWNLSFSFRLCNVCASYLPVRRPDSSPTRMWSSWPDDLLVFFKHTAVTLFSLHCLPAFLNDSLEWIGNRTTDPAVRGRQLTSSYPGWRRSVPPTPNPAFVAKITTSSFKSRVISPERGDGGRVSAPLTSACRVIMRRAQQPLGRPGSCLCIIESAPEGKPLTKQRLPHTDLQSVWAPTLCSFPMWAEIILQHQQWGETETSEDRSQCDRLVSNPTPFSHFSPTVNDLVDRVPFTEAACWTHTLRIDLRWLTFLLFTAN